MDDLRSEQPDDEPVDARDETHSVGSPPDPVVNLLAAANRALKAVAPHAFLVEPRVLRRVIKQEWDLPAMTVNVPHRKSWVISRNSLIRHVDWDELGLQPNADLPDRAILLARPDDKHLESMSLDQLKVGVWKLLFHSTVHLEFDRLRESGRLTAAGLRERIHQLGQVEFDEIHAVLRREGFIHSTTPLPDVYVEFAAVYAELRCFVPHCLGSYFPSFENYETVDRLLERDLSIAELYRRTRLAGSPDPVPETEHDETDQELESLTGHRADEPLHEPRLLATAEDDLTRADESPREHGPSADSGNGPQTQAMTTRDGGPLDISKPSLLDEAARRIKSPGRPSLRTFGRLIRKADKAFGRGNAVGAAIYQVKAARAATPELVSEAMSGALGDVQRLVRRLQAALGFDDVAARAWYESLAALLLHSYRGFWNADKRLLHDLQRVCVDHEREIYTVDLVGFVASFGGRPIKRALPNQREVLMSKHLRSATRRLVAARLTGAQRRRLSHLLHEAASLAEAQMRTRLRPLTAQALQNVGLGPDGIPERVAFQKLTEELLDGVVTRGFLTMGNLRDAISRSNLKMDDLSGPGEFLFGDRLLRANRELARVLDGVYQRGDIYLAWLQRLSACAFGTQIGRFLTRYVAIPYGGAFLAFEALIHVFEMFLHHEPVEAAEGDDEPDDPGTGDDGVVDTVRNDGSPDGSDSEANIGRQSDGRNVESDADSAVDRSEPDDAPPSDAPPSDAPPSDAASSDAASSDAAREPDDGTASPRGESSPRSGSDDAEPAPDRTDPAQADRSDLESSRAADQSDTKEAGTAAQSDVDATRQAPDADAGSNDAGSNDAGSNDAGSTGGSSESGLAESSSEPTDRADAASDRSASDDESAKQDSAPDGRETGGDTVAADAGDGGAASTTDDSTAASTDAAVDRNGTELTATGDQSEVDVDGGSEFSLIEVAPPSPVKIWKDRHGDSVIFALGTFILLLMHVSSFRRRVFSALQALFSGLRRMCYEWPVRFFRQPIVRRILRSTPVTLFRKFIVGPLIPTAILCWGLPALYPQLGTQEPLQWLTVLTAMSVILNSRVGRDVEELTAEWLHSTWTRIRVHIFVALFDLVMDTFKRLLEWFERVLYAVDEWLRFKSGETTFSLALKAVLGVFWAGFTFVARFCVNLLIEPQINPIKHFPVVTVSHKLLIPLAPMFVDLLTPLVGSIDLARAIVGPTIFVVPGVFGFMAWELRSNWQLYKANRGESLRPVLVGSHGETFIRLMKPGFHSGTLPKIFSRLRRVDRRRIATEHSLARSRYLDQLHHVHADVRHFVERELLTLLTEFDDWTIDDVRVSRLRLASNNIRIELTCPSRGDSPLVLVFEEQSGWLVANAMQSGWVANLSEREQVRLLTALIGFYRLAGVDLVREQIYEAFHNRGLPYDVSEEGLVVWPDAEYSAEAIYNLRHRHVIRPYPRGVARQHLLPALPVEQLIFASTELRWDDWEAQCRLEASNGISEPPGSVAWKWQTKP